MRTYPWQSMFTIVCRENWIEDGDLGSHWDIRYDLENVYSNEVIASYKDLRYAKKQARYKYKKLTKLIERNLMS